MPSLKNAKKTHKKLILKTKHISRPKPKAKPMARRHSAHTKPVSKKHPTPAQHAAAAKIDHKQKEAQEAQARLASDMKHASAMLENRNFALHIDGKAGPSAVEILKSLTKNPKTDEDIATQLNMKVNDVRRALNLMNGYSIVKYDVSKDNKGWLIFKWKINNEKLDDYINNIERELKSTQEPNLPGNCNDFFICKKCYPTLKVVLPFDSAFESGFTCDCGKPYIILNRQEAVELFKAQK